MDLKTPLMILMSMAGLLVAMCAINVATLLLLRAAGRAREMSMRYALGAKRSRVISQLLVEGGLLGMAGGAAGLALAPLVATSLVRFMTSSDPGSEPYSTSIDAASCCSLWRFVLSPACCSASRLSFTSCVLTWPRRCARMREPRPKVRNASARLAVGVQIALSVLLLGGAGLFVRTLDNLRGQKVGFETSNLVTFSLDPTNSGYGEDRTPQIVTNVLDAIGRIPGVASVSSTTDPELSWRQQRLQLHRAGLQGSRR